MPRIIMRSGVTYAETRNRLRGCALMAPNFLARTSYSGTGGRGGGIGSNAPQSGQGVSRGSGRGRGADASAVNQDEAEEQGQSPANISGRGRIANWANASQTLGRGVGAGTILAGGGRGRGIGVFSPQEVERQDSSRSAGLDLFGRGRGMPTSPTQAGSGRGSVSDPSPSPESRVPRKFDDSDRDANTRFNPSMKKTSSSAGKLKSEEVGTAKGGDIAGFKLESKEKGTAKVGDVGSSLASPERSLTAVEQLLASLSKVETKVQGATEPKVKGPPQSSAPSETSKLPFRLPLLNLRPAPEHQQEQQPKQLQQQLGQTQEQQPEQQQQQSRQQQPQPQQQQLPLLANPFLQAQTPLPLNVLGRGRGQTDAFARPAIGSDAVLFDAVDSISGRQQQELSPSRWFDGSPGRASQVAPRPGSPPRPPSPPRPGSPPRVQLSAEEAGTRAMAILEKGIEKNVAAEGERRRVAGMDKFADASEFMSDRFRRAPGQSSSPQISRRRTETQRPAGKSDRPRRQRSVEDNVLEASPAQNQLTPEQEERILQIQAEDTFKERLHNWFLVNFEPEYAMEEFGRNPDIDEPPVLSLEDYLRSLKPMFLSETAELTEEQKWEDAVKTSLANAPNLEKLVDSYAGPGRMTARQQIKKLETISQALPTSVSPEEAAFTHRALNTLQNNPGLNMRHKERLMSNIVSGFSR